MLYIGHFSFFKNDVEEAVASGFFNCVAEAEGPEEAMDKFAELLDGLKNSGDDIFDDVDDVYLDQCTEISSMPAAGFLDYWMTLEPVPQGVVTTSLRGVEPGQATAFVLGSDEEGAEEDEEEGSEPFICWGEGHEHE